MQPTFHPPGLSPAGFLHASHVSAALGHHLGQMVPHRAPGGMIPAQQTSAMAPARSTQDLLQYAAVQRLQAMAPDELKQMLPRLGDTPMAKTVQGILDQKLADQRDGVPHPDTPALARGGHAPLSPSHPGAGLQAAPGTVPILAAGGEFVIAPHHVMRLGDGDIKEGHRRLDAWVVNARGSIVKTMTKLKPPVKS